MRLKFNVVSHGVGQNRMESGVPTESRITDRPGHWDVDFNLSLKSHSYHLPRNFESTQLLAPEITVLRLTGLESFLEKRAREPEAPGPVFPYSPK